MLILLLWWKRNNQREKNSSHVAELPQSFYHKSLDKKVKIPFQGHLKELYPVIQILATERSLETTELPHWFALSFTGNHFNSLHSSLIQRPSHTVSEKWLYLFWVTWSSFHFCLNSNYILKPDLTILIKINLNQCSLSYLYDLGSYAKLLSIFISSAV